MDRIATQSQDDDRRLVEAARDGDPAAFQELLRQGDPAVRGVVRGVLGNADRVEDVTQKVWISAWQRLSRLRDVSRWRSWLHSMARNAATDEGRNTTRRRRLEGELTDAATCATSAPHPGSDLIEGERRQAVRRAIDDLPEIYRVPLMLRHVHDRSYREIAEQLDLPLDTVETRLVRARRRLRETLREQL